MREPPKPPCKHANRAEERVATPRIVWTHRWCRDCNAELMQHQAKDGRTAFFWKLPRTT